MSLPLVYVIDTDHEIQQLLADLVRSGQIAAKNCSSAEVFLAEYDPDLVGCVLSEVFLAGMSGLALQRELAQRRLLVPVVFVSGLSDIALAVEAMSAGAFHILQKPIRADELSSVLIRAIRADRSRREARLFERALLSRFKRLTPRELEVFEQVISGATNKEIADKLAISFRTVECHRSNLMDKLQVDSGVKLFEFWFQFKRIENSVDSS